MSETAHTPTPDDELDQGAFDVCKRCQLPIVQHWERRKVWVAMVSGSAVCYGLRP